MRSIGTQSKLSEAFFTSYEFMQSLNSSQADLGVFSLTLRLLWVLDTLHFNSSALNQQQSGFLRFCEFPKYPFVMLKLSDAVICHCMNHTENDSYSDKSQSTGIHSEQKLSLSLWQVHNPMHSWIFVMVLRLPLSTLNMVDKVC
jgi:hypothetical protein